MRAMKRLGLILAAAVLTSGAGCDKLKAMAGRGDAAAPASGGGGGGLLSMLDSSFEGEVTMDIAGRGNRGGPKTLVFGVKSPKIRVDLAAVTAGGNDNPMLAQGAAFIIDPPAKKGYMLVPAKKMAMVIDFEQAKQMKGARIPGAAGGTPSAPSEPPKIEKTGKKETIAGYSCEDWKVTNKDGTRAELCVAEGIKWMDLTDLGMQSPELAAAAALHDLNHFPLKLVTYDAAGAETSRVEAKKIDKKKLDDALFAVPPDYQQMDMNQMIQGLAGGLGSAGMPGGRPPWPHRQPPKRP